MKKFKLLPSVIMLIICFLTLCTGVCCASVISVAINGNLSIIPADLSNSASVTLRSSSLVDATMTIDNNIVSQHTSVTNVKMRLGEVDEGKDVLNIELAIKNTGSTQVGMFFSTANTVITPGVPAVETDILLTETISRDSDTLATLYFTSYTPLDSQETGIMKIKIYLTGIDNSSVLESFAYNLQVENYVSTTNYQSATGFVKVPYNEIVNIASTTFANKNNISILALPNTVTTIDDGTAFDSVFGSVESLKGVNLQWVTKLGSYAFKECRYLVSVALNQGLTELPDGVFCNTSSLESIDIPKTIVTIGASAFWCGALRELDLREYTNLVSIGDGAFDACPFKTVSFYGCSQLTTIGAGAFMLCDMISVDFTDCISLKTIGGEAFMMCSYLQSIKIVSSVTTIDDGAFDSCDSLNTVVIESAAVAKKYDSISYNVDGLLDNATYVYIKSGLSVGPYLSNTRNYSRTTISSGTYSGYVLYTKL